MNLSFSNKLKNAYPSIRLEEVERFQAEYAKRRYHSVKSNIEGKDFARNCCMFLLCVLQRSFNLYKGAIKCLNDEDVLVSFLAARAHMEATGSVAYFSVQLQKYYKKEISYDDIDACLMKLHLGRKNYSDDEVYPEKIDTIGVMTLIDSVDKVFFKSMEDKKRKQIFRNTYEWLSEFCHPNHFGQIVGVFQEGRKAIFEYDHFPEQGDVHEVFFSLASSCSMFFPMYDSCFSLISEHEKMPELLK